ncbi:(+)-neomenthol dehydrogenase [Dioscorea cayenensis subsp. rotundata]|uniref:Short-chain dehydrogenase/reductase n=1 Tax=Dioscorea cayennensis subsp. rotundata TaxID=55577 RepID=A0AB40BAB2_DIOCR|nr:(+)-neomenthol dehydrogenase [Dioscorea cayenensis subsp. rotundata]
MEYTQNTKTSPFPTEHWWSKDTVAVITGANKGIGFSLAKRLAQLGLTVVLTSRDAIKGQEAVESLRAQNLHVEYSQLDVSNLQSISSFVFWLSNKFGGLDILINNAAVSFNEVDTNSVEYAETVIKTNFYGPKLLIQALLPLFRRSTTASRILNISSQLGLLNKVKNPKLREMLRNEENLCEGMIDQMVANFLQSVKNGTWKEEGWPEIWTDYSVSKLALNAHSSILARLHGNDHFKVNCFCPGYTRTNMTGGRGSRTADEAAELAVNIILLPRDRLPNGKFFKLSTPLLFSKL